MKRYSNQFETHYTRGRKMQFNYYNNTDPVQEIDGSGYTRINVIASFRNDGKLIPLKFQIELNDERNSYDVSVARTVENKDFVTFHCYYEREFVKHQIELIYLIKNHIWLTPTPGR